MEENKDILTLTPSNEENHALTPQTNTTETLQAMVTEFLSFVDVRPITRKAYANALNRFVSYVKAENIANLTRADLLAYKAYLERQGLSAGTRHQYEQALKQFFSWITATTGAPNLAYKIKSTQVRNDISRRDSFSLKDVNKILDSINTNTLAGARDYALISLLADCGLRLIEIQRANIEDLERRGDYYTLAIQGKGHREKDSTVYITSERTRSAIDGYLAKRKNADKHAPLFASCCHRENNGGRINKNALCQLVKNRIKGAGYDSKKLSAHSFRHTFVTECIKITGDIYTAQKLARHSKPEVTEIYDNAREENLLHATRQLQAHITQETEVNNY